MDVNTVVLTGRITRTVELRKTNSGLAVADIPVANNLLRKNGSERTIYPKVTCWDKQAEWCAANLGTGDTVFVEGILADDNYEQDGQTTSGRLKIDNARITRVVTRSGNNNSSEESGAFPDESELEG